MFWKIILSIYIATTLLVFVLQILTAQDMKRRLLRIHPDIKPSEESRGLVWFSALLRGFILAAIPLFHFMLLIGYTAMSERIIKTGIHDAEVKLREEGRIV